jgi:flagellar hook assembly protein FlgD
VNVNAAQNQLIIKFKPSVDQTRFLNMHKELNARIEKKITKRRIVRMDLPKGIDLNNVIRDLKKDTNIEFIEPNYIYSVEYTPNDPNYNLQWSLPKMKVDKAWDISTNSNSRTIAIVDTGVDSDHPDLASDIVAGYNAITDTTNTNDDQGHGTHVAGIAAGMMGNGIGIAGTAGNAKIMPVKVLDSSGSGNIYDISEGIIWAADRGANIINMSLGGSGYSQTLQDAVDYAYSKGVLVIAAAGNSNSSAPSYPAALNHVISVVATDENNNKAWFSNYGTTVDISAPGTNIYSSTFNGSYGYMQGTSMACPNVTGVAALVWAQNTNLTPDQVENILESKAQDLGTVGKDTTFGFGLVDAYAAIMAAKPTPKPGLPPVGSIDNPTHLETIKDTYLVKGWFLDVDGVTKIEILIDGQVIGQATYGDYNKSIGDTFKDYANYNCGFHYSFDTTKVINGEHSITVRETSTLGKQTTLIGTKIIIGNKLPPVGMIEKPQASDTISGIYVVKGWFLDDSIVSKIEIILDGTAIATATYGDSRTDIGSKYPDYNNNNCGFSYYLDTNNLLNGSHNITIRETASTGLQVTLPNIPIYINNTSNLPAQGAIENPTWGETFNGIYTVKGWFLDGGGVSKLDVLLDGNIIGQAAYGDSRQDIYTQYPGYKNANAGFHYDFDTTKVTPGTYTLNIHETSASGQEKTLLGTLITITKTPPKPTQAKQAKITYNLSKDSKVTISILDSLGNVVKVLETNALKQKGINYAYWDGKNTAGSFVPDGVYTYKITAVSLAGLSANPITGSVTIERLNPSISLVSDSPDPFMPGGTISNTIKYTLSENAKVVLAIYDASGNQIKNLVNENKIIGENKASWDGADSNGKVVSSGTYTYRIDATDAFGKKAIQAAGTIVVDTTKPEILGLSVSPQPFAPMGSNSVTISFNLTKPQLTSIQILNSSNEVVKNIESSLLRAKGQSSVLWDGRNSEGNIVSDENYKVKISATDLSGFSAVPVDAAIIVNTGSPAFSFVNDSPDPFCSNNSVNTIKFFISKNARASVKIFDSNGTLVKALADENVQKGNNAYNWDGKNDSGASVKSGTYTYKLNAADSIGNKADEVIGTITVDNDAPEISGLSAAPQPFAADGTKQLSISYTLSENASTTLTILDGNKNIVATLVDNVQDSAGSHVVTWNGRNSSGQVVPDATYSYNIVATDVLGLTSDVAAGTFVVETNNPILGLISCSPNPFNNKLSSSSIIKYSISEAAKVTVKLYDANSILVRTIFDDTVNTGNITCAWDGKNDAGADLANGNYVLKINAKDTAGKDAPEITANYYIDTIAPTITNNFLSSTAFSPKSSETTTIYYTLSENARVTVEIFDSSNKLISTIEKNVLKPSGSNAIEWDGADSVDAYLPQGAYKYKVSAVDLAGIPAVPVTGSITINAVNPVITNESVTPSAFRTNNGGTCTIKYDLSKTLKVTVKIFDAYNGLVVRTLTNATLSAGTKYVTWDGRNNYGTFVYNQVYKFRITAYDSKSKILDQVAGNVEIDNIAPEISQTEVSPQPFAPVGTNKATISYNLSEDAKVSILIYSTRGQVIREIANNVSKLAGLNQVDWDGKNIDGVICADGTYTLKIDAVDSVGHSAVTQFVLITIEHERPVFTDLKLNPVAVNPNVDGAVANISFVISEDAAVNVGIVQNGIPFNVIDGTGIARKITIDQPVSAGTNSLTWDGKDDSGKIVADGNYGIAFAAKNKLGIYALSVSMWSVSVDTVPPTISSNYVSPTVFSPNDGQTAIIFYNISENALLTTKIYDSSDNLIDTVQSDSPKYGQFQWAIWDGKDSSGKVVKDGIYTYKINATDFAGFVSNQLTGTVTVSNYPVVYNISESPDPFRPGYNSCVIKYSLSKDSNLALKIYNSNNSWVDTIFSSYVTAGDKSVSWDGKNGYGKVVSDGEYTYKFFVLDSKNNVIKQVSEILNVDTTVPKITNISVTPSNLVPNGSNNVTISYTLSEKALVTSTIYDSTNQIIKTLESSSVKSSGQNLTMWDGKDSTGSIVADGLYTFKITAIDFVDLQAMPSTGTIAVGEMPVISSASSAPNPFRPVGNNVDTIKYDISKNAKVTIGIYDTSDNLVKTIQNANVNKGSNSATWDGKGITGQIVSNGNYTYKIDAVDVASRSAVQNKGNIFVDLNAPVISSNAVSPDYFSPSKEEKATISYNLSEQAKVTIKIYDQTGSTLIDTINENELINSGNAKASWDGKNAGGDIVSDGTYVYKINAIDLVGLAATQASGKILVGDKPQITGVSDSPDPFRPIGSNANTIKYTLSKKANVDIKIYDKNDNLVRIILNSSLSAGSKTATWDGKNAAGNIVGSGTYQYAINAVDDAGISADQVLGTIEVDVTPPQITQVTASPDVFAPTGSNVAMISYYLSESAAVTIKIVDSNNSLVSTILNNVSKGSGSNSAAWDGKGLDDELVPDGTYSYKITAVDRVGLSTTVIGSIIIRQGYPSITSVSDSPDPFAPVDGNVNTLKFTLSKKATVVIKLYSSQGALVKELMNTVLAAGDKTVSWNGKDSSGNAVESGIYTYKINATDSGGRKADEVAGTIEVDLVAPEITGDSIEPDPFEPIG